MKDLPIELVGAVADSISSTSDLLSLRSVNSTCHHLVTPQVFRRIHIQNSVQSAQNCQSIIASPTLGAHVRQVVYDHRDFAQCCLLPGAEGACDELEIAELEDALTETFCSLKDFKNLESVVLNFWPSFRSQSGMEIQEHPFWFTNRQITVLHAMHYALKSSPIRSLRLNNVVLAPQGHYDFVSALKNSPLHHFSMSVVANSELSTWSGSKALNGSLSVLLPVSNTNLKSLVLRSPEGLYHSPNLQLGNCNYPGLELLVLENIVFDHVPSADSIEEFIIRHKTSLRRLELRTCSSHVPNTTTPVRRWSTIWNRLEQELVSLTELVVSSADMGYTLFDPARGYVPYPSLEEQTLDDVERCLQFGDRVNVRSIVAEK